MKTIAVISDNPFWHKFVVETLNGNGYQARHRTFGSCLERVPKVDLILLDEFFAGVRWEQVLDLVTRAKEQKVRVAYTAGGRPGDLAQIYQAGAVYNFGKTFETLKLCQEVEESFRHGLPP